MRKNTYCLARELLLETRQGARDSGISVTCCAKEKGVCAMSKEFYATKDALQRARRNGADPTTISALEKAWNLTRDQEEMADTRACFAGNGRYTRWLR